MDIEQCRVKAPPPDPSFSLQNFLIPCFNPSQLRPAAAAATAMVAWALEGVGALNKRELTADRKSV